MIDKPQQIESAIRELKKSKTKQRQKNYFVSCHDLMRGMGSLSVQVSSTGFATFRYIQKVNGKRTYIVIGKYSREEEGGVTISQAREEALKYGVLAKKGINVKLHNQAEKEEQEKQKKLAAIEEKLGSLSQLIDSYIQTMKDEGKRTWERVLKSVKKDVYPLIEPTQRANTVTDEQIINVLSTMIERGPEVQSNRVRSYLHRAFKLGLQHDKNPKKMNRDILFGLKINPVTNIPRQASAEKPGERFLSKNEFKRLLKLLDECQGISKWSANIIKLCIYSGGQRPWEVITLKPDSINFDDKYMQVTPEYSKNKRNHLVPLTETTLNITEWFHHSCRAVNAEFLIFKRTDLSDHYRSDSLSKAVTRFCEFNKFPRFCPRFLRRTCKTHMGSIGISKELRDRIQNHSFNDVSSKHYDRWEYLPEKRKALEAWEQWCLALKNEDEK